MSKISEAAEQLEAATENFEENAQTAEETVAEAKGEETTQETIDLDRLERFKFQGKEWTPEEINKAMLMQSDYTKKTQELAKERKFIDNLGYDLDNVRSGIATVEQFKAVYPERFHHLVETALNTAKADPETTQDDEPDTIKTLQQTVEELRNKLETYENKFQDEKVEAETARLDAIFTKMGSKYELADEDAVMNAAQRLLEENRDNPNFVFTDGVWERLYKRDHEKRVGILEEYNGKLMKNQESLNKKGTDGGPGGQPPGRERKRFSFDEATEMAIQDLSR